LGQREGEAGADQVRRRGGQGCPFASQQLPCFCLPFSQPPPLAPLCYAPTCWLFPCSPQLTNTPSLPPPPLPVCRQGLLEPPKPKIKISNMYRVLTEASVDPTAIEQRVSLEWGHRRGACDHLGGSVLSAWMSVEHVHCWCLCWGCWGGVGAGSGTPFARWTRWWLQNHSCGWDTGCTLQQLLPLC
jgi:hypothetical protein